MVPLIVRMILGQKLSSMGRGLIARLLHLNIQQGTSINTEHAFAKLLTRDDGAVTGAEVQTRDGLLHIKAKSVILAAGGFARNKVMREATLPSPASTEWTSVQAGDDGDAIRAGTSIGADTALMDDAWWGPTIIDPVTNKPWFLLIERARPHCIMVDAEGSRFMNEAESYTDAGHHQYERNTKVKAIPCWLIMDATHRKRYMFGPKLFARMKIPQKALDEGRIFKADSLEALASQIGVDPSGLRTTITRYNSICTTGIDTDFQKGNNAYDNFFGDPKVKPNPNMGPLETAPFYAVPVWPGDLGTKGGLLTDEFQRVLRKDGTVVEGLYACGNTAASIMGRTYLGAGSTLGPAMTHGFIAANHLQK
jgi:succinate dehydrogenase/fumarate reductase flavoprotein subunit